MVRSTCKITLLFVWVVLVREVLTQDQKIPDTAAPEIQNMMLGANQESEDDATEMGRNAAEDMGALMASKPIKIFRPQQSMGVNDGRSSGSSVYQYAREADVSQCQRYGSDAYSGQPSGYPGKIPQDAQWYPESGMPFGRYGDTSQDSQWYPSSGPLGDGPRDTQWYSEPRGDSPQDSQWYSNSGRSAIPRTAPLAPLPPLPLIAGVSPLPMLSPLIQSLTNPGRLGLGFGPRPLLRTPLPYAMPTFKTPFAMPALNSPLTMPTLKPLLTMPTFKSPLTMPTLKSPLTMPWLRSFSPMNRLPRMNRVWIPPSLRTARSSYTPSKYARNPNQQKPLVFYV